jgi:putative ABC transport system permease protein
MAAGPYNQPDMAIMVTVDNLDAVNDVTNRITALLRQAHKIGPKDPDDFKVESSQSITKSIERVSSTITIVISAIVGISLLVGGVGIMNIMLVSVTERTREIGIRMAVGAQPTDIMMQFLVEALVLSAVGGALGVIFGVGLGQVIAPKFGWTMETKTQIVFISLAVSAGVGILFGLYPARKASRLDPIDALRYE